MGQPQRKDEDVVKGVGAPSGRPTHSEDGVDLTLIRWMLSLTPLERLQVLQRNIRALRKLQDAASHLR